ncbi:site-specific integrase [Rhizobium tropici]|uniref:Integrase n=1 Tax=Rhizobium tropici TaxID=398 RepID=A0A329YCT1_RHITR|nr:site-specific integrase [Rhizobium tropici]RAX40738.1 integrase [Rhizobium tropici]
MTSARKPPTVLKAAFLSNPPKVAKGKRQEFRDAATKGLAARVNDKGQVSFIYVGRFPGGKGVDRRTIGIFDEKAAALELDLQSKGKDLPRPPAAMSLARARAIAGEWSTLIAMGIDPAKHEGEIAAERDRRRQNTFAAVVEDYLEDIPTRKRNRHAEQDKREIRRELLERKDKDGKVWKNPWASKPIAEVTDADVAELIVAIRDGKHRERAAPGQAYNTWGHIKALFSWAMWPERRQGYGLTVNPVAHLQPKHFKLSKTASTRTLTDDEIRAYWAAAEDTPYPLGQFYKLLLLTGQRKNEVAGARRSEISDNRQLWTVPSERFKSGQEHIVPLSNDAMSLIRDLPKFEGENSGECLFSTTNGKKAINGFSRAKSALDEAMLKKLQETNPDATLPDWVFHDIRRTVRTRLSGLRINSEIAEMVIGHGKTGLRRVYDQHEYEPEMREALERWAAALRQMIAPEPSPNVVTLDRKSA